MEFSTPRRISFSFHGYRTWYRIVGDQEDEGKFPLLCLHGGPGMSHDYLEPLEAIAETGRRVIFYDQLGCGNSDHPHDPALWNIGFVCGRSGRNTEISWFGRHPFARSIVGRIPRPGIHADKTIRREEPDPRGQRCQHATLDCRGKSAPRGTSRRGAGNSQKA